MLWLALSSAQAIDFVHEIVPILRQHCVECHGEDKAKGGFSLNTRALFLEDDAAVPGDAAESYFLELIQETDPDAQMPPEDKPRVPAEQIALLKRWVDEGLPWEPGFTFAKGGWEPPLQPRTVELPPAREGRSHPIDRILDADLAKRGEALPSRASDAAFLRRVTLDVIGLLPTPEELEAFVKDPDPDKRVKKIDALLADDIGYADHWLTTWNDLLRNDYTGTGFITGGRKQITTWLYAALRENKPFDEFVRELIAPSSESAGFINGIKWRGDVNASQTTEIQFSQNISQVFLGINMKCASCHDSFIDRWTLSEAYNLAAIYSDKPLELFRCDKPTGEMATPKWVFPEIGDVDPEAPKEERLRQLAALMTHPENGRFTRTLVNRLWERLMGRGIVHPVDAMHTEPWNEDLLDHLALQFAEKGHDLRRLMRYLMTSQAYQSEGDLLQAEPGEDYAYAGPVAKRMTAEQFLDAIWQVTKTHPAKAEAKVDRTVRAPESTASVESDVVLKQVPVGAHWIWHAGPTGKRSQLRKTLTLAEATTAARLMVTCDNAFTMKLNGKVVAESQDWQKPLYVDLSRHLVEGDNVIDVVAEMFGGSAGFICQIDYLEGGAQKQVVSDRSWEARASSDVPWAAAAELKAHGEGPWGELLDPAAKPGASGGASPPVRAALVKNDFLMRSLGRPHRDQVVTSRPAELTTLQAIDLANGDILAEFLQRGAQNLFDEASDSSQTASAVGLGDWLFRFALSRPPTEGESEVIEEVIGAAASVRSIEDLLWLVFMLPEFQMIR